MSITETEKTEAPITVQVCDGCTDAPFMAELTEIPCEHSYCSNCMKDLFNLAMHDETSYPPRCCGRRIPLRVASKNLPMGFVRRFKAKRLEMKTRNKTYCYRPTCSAFIAPHSIHNGVAICQKCNARTCTKCRGKWHWGFCDQNSDAEFFEFIKKTGFKQCPECRRMIEKSEGCNHMTCRCGAEFCYRCGQDMGDCGCDSDEGEDEDDVLEEVCDMQCGLFD